MSLYAAWFENCFSQYPEIRNFSLSDGSRAINGLAINGLETAGTDTFLALPDRRREINERLEAACSRIEAEFFEPQEAQRRGQRYENAVASLRSAMERIKTACEEGEKIASGALHTRRALHTGGALHTGRSLRQNPDPGEQEKTLAALDTVNSLISSSEVKEIAGFLFPPQALEEIGQDKRSGEKDAFREYLESLITLYRSLAQAIEVTVPKSPIL
jgi:hypothetical protein